jgi:hypothetical protein
MPELLSFALRCSTIGTRNLICLLYTYRPCQCPWVDFIMKDKKVQDGAAFDRSVSKRRLTFAWHGRRPAYHFCNTCLYTWGPNALTCPGSDLCAIATSKGVEVVPKALLLNLHRRKSLRSQLGC